MNHTNSGITGCPLTGVGITKCIVLEVNCRIRFKKVPCAKGQLSLLRYALFPSVLYHRICWVPFGATVMGWNLNIDTLCIVGISKISALLDNATATWLKLIMCIIELAKSLVFLLWVITRNKSMHLHIAVVKQG